MPRYRSADERMVNTPPHFPTIHLRPASPRTYTYSCSTHPKMTGTVMVE
jgi:plastocyanin